MKSLKKIFNFFNCVLILEFKNLNLIIDRIFNFFINFNLFNLFIYKLGFKNVNPITSKSFQNFINEKKNPLTEKNIKEDENIILVENFINQASYTYQNLVCRKLSQFPCIISSRGIIAVYQVYTAVLYSSSKCTQL